MIYSLGSGKMVPVGVNQGDPRNNLKPGTVLYLNGYSNPKYVIVKNEGVNDTYYYGARYRTINLQDGSCGISNAFELIPLSAMKDNRIQMYITDQVLGPEEIMDAIDFSVQKNKERIAAAALKDQQKAAEREEILSQYSFLQKVEDIGKPGRVIGAVNIRTELKRNFPGVKFSVRSDSFSMGNSIDIEWTGGPERKAVEAITDKYQYGTFDSMTDCSGYKDEQFTKIFGGAKYVQCQRRETV